MTDFDKFRLCFVPGTFAWFTDCVPFWDVSADDWNDAPYEHNASRPYEWDGHSLERGVDKYGLIRVAWAGDFETPADMADGSSRYSVDAINRGAVAWLTKSRWAGGEFVAIAAGVTLPEFERLIKLGGGEVYFRREDLS